MLRRDGPLGGELAGHALRAAHVQHRGRLLVRGRGVRSLDRGRVRQERVRSEPVPVRDCVFSVRIFCYRVGVVV